ncbi:MAG: ABC transporter permease subunit, partial [Phaeodactylibacter sp.]|nr:ABC transporter permease subunit [Phaeodactylibacter sp.]
LYSLGLTGAFSDGFTLVHWQEVLGDKAFWLTIGFSLYVAFCSIAIALFLSLILVLRSPGAFTKGIMSYFIYLPLSIPAIVMAFFVFQLMGKGGWLSRLSYQLGITQGLEHFPDWVNDNFGIGIIVAHVIMATPFFTIFFANLYENERLTAYLQLAATLGAKKSQQTFKVAVPILLRRGMATIFLYFMFVMGSYEIPLLVGSQSVQMVSIRTIQRLQRFDLGEIPEAFVINIAYTIIVAILLTLLLWYNRQQLGSK